MLTGVIPRGQFDNALFESISGFTCSGSTILVNFDAVPQGVLHRSLTQWLEEWPIVLAVAVLPALGIGGGSDRWQALALRRTDLPCECVIRPGSCGCSWRYDGRATLVLLTIGMSAFDAVTHAFTTISTGGFYAHAESIAYFDSFTIELILMVGMLLSGASFSIHWHALRQGIGAYRRVSEVRWYLSLVFGAFGMLMGQPWRARMAAEP